MYPVGHVFFFRTKNDKNLFIFIFFIIPKLSKKNAKYLKTPTALEDVK